MLYLLDKDVGIIMGDSPLPSRDEAENTSAYRSELQASIKPTNATLDNLYQNSIRNQAISGVLSNLPL